MITHGKGLSWSRPATLLALAAVATGCGARDAVAPRLAAEGKVSAQLGPFATWSPAVRIEAAWPGADPSFNTPFLDGCPASSRDGKTFFLATNRPDSHGISHGIDIYASRRESVDDPWGEPVRLAEPINSESNDFCPMPARDGHEFFFVSNRPGGCGGDDIYVTRFRDHGAIDTPQNLGCDVNSVGNEAGPVPITEPGRGPVLYFSSTRAGGFSAEPLGATTGDADLYSVHPGGRPLIVRHRGAKLTKVVYADPRGTRTVPTTYDERMALVLTDDELQQIAAWSVAADQHFRRPMALEWAKDGVTGSLFVVEARPWAVPTVTIAARGRSAAVPRHG